MSRPHKWRPRQKADRSLAAPPANLPIYLVVKGEGAVVFAQPVGVGSKHGL